MGGPLAWGGGGGNLPLSWGKQRTDPCILRESTFSFWGRRQVCDPIQLIQCLCLSTKRAIWFMRTSQRKPSAATQGRAFSLAALYWTWSACQCHIRGCVRRYQRHIRGLPGAYQWRIRGVSGAHWGRIRGVLKAYHRRIRDTSGACQEPAGGGASGGLRSIRHAGSFPTRDAISGVPSLCNWRRGVSNFL